MYLVFKMVDQRLLGPITVTGRWLDYCVGFLPDTHKDVIPFLHLNAVVVPEEVGKAWMFNSAWNGTVSVRAGTPQNDILQLYESTEPAGTKTKYNLTDEQKSAGAEFIKIVLRKKLDEVYDTRMMALNLGVSDLEMSTWATQREEARWYNEQGSEASTPLLASLATARGITLAEMVQKVTSAIQGYEQSIADLLASKQAVEKEIKACETIADCHVLMHERFDYAMAPKLREQLNYIGASQLNL